MSISFRGAIGDLSDNTKPKRFIRLCFLSFPVHSSFPHDAFKSRDSLRNPFDGDLWVTDWRGQRRRHNSEG